MWNYRIIKKSSNNDLHYGLYEVFYNNSGEICAHAENPDIVGESIEDIKKTLKLMLKDVDKYETLEWGEIEFKDWGD